MFGCGLLLRERMTFVPEAEMLGSESNKTLDRAGMGVEVVGFDRCLLSLP